MFRLLLMGAMLFSGAAPAAPAAPAESGVERTALDAVVHDPCHRDVALLGEADHGDGRAVGPMGSALGGAHWWMPQEPSRPIAQAAPGSVGAQAMAGSRADIVHLGPARLAALGGRQGYFYKHQPLETRWDAVMDGAIVFRAERAPRRTD